MILLLVRGEEICALLKATTAISDVVAPAEFGSVWARAAPCRCRRCVSSSLGSDVDRRRGKVLVGLLASAFPSTFIAPLVAHGSTSRASQSARATAGAFDSKASRPTSHSLLGLGLLGVAARCLVQRRATVQQWNSRVWLGGHTFVWLLKACLGSFQDLCQDLCQDL